MNKIYNISYKSKIYFFYKLNLWFAEMKVSIVVNLIWNPFLNIAYLLAQVA